MMEPECDPDILIPSVYFTRSVFNPDTLTDEPVTGTWRRQLFHGVWLVLRFHVAEQRLSIESFFLDHQAAGRMGQLFDKQIQSLVRYNCWPWRAYGVAKLRKIYLLAVLSTDAYIGFFGDLLRTFAANHNGKEMSDRDLPIEGSQVRGLPEKYAEAFREFLWYQHLINHNFCGRSCRFSLDSTNEKLGGKLRLPDTFIYNEEEILAEMREVRDAALALSLLSHVECQRDREELR